MNGAHFSPDRVYRYTLVRDIGPEVGVNGTLNFIGLNPSTADELLDDPTVRRCIRFARDWGYGPLVVTNAFAYRATDPALLSTVQDPVGPDNDLWLANVAAESTLVIAAWSGLAQRGDRDAAVRTLLRKVGARVACLGLTKDGSPRHPLYMKASTQPQEFKL